MKNSRQLFIFSIALIACACVLFVACKEEKKETVLDGSLTVYVDETLRPIAEDQAAVFESQYPGKITIVSKPEAEIVNMMLTGVATVAVLSRRLSEAEYAYFKNKKIKPRVTPFAKDAVAFVTNEKSADSIIDLEDVSKLLHGQTSRIKGLVFENPNSSTVRYIDSIASVAKGPKKNVYSFNSHKEVLEYVSANSGMVGVVGLNMLVQPDPDIEALTGKVTVCAVRNVKKGPGTDQHFKPNQSNIGTGSYPLTRQLYVLNYQGKVGLGTGFASFVSGETGQLIILKSGLLPVRLPGRNIIVRKNITINN